MNLVEELQKSYLEADMDHNCLVDEAIGTLESYFPYIDHDELINRNRPLAIAYLALKTLEKDCWHSGMVLPEHDGRILFQVRHDTEAKEDNIYYTGYFTGEHFNNDEGEGYWTDSYYSPDNVIKWKYLD